MTVTYIVTHKHDTSRDKKRQGETIKACKLKCIMDLASSVRRGETVRDKACFDYESEGRKFESSRVHYRLKSRPPIGVAFSFGVAPRL